MAHRHRSFPIIRLVRLSWADRCSTRPQPWYGHSGRTEVGTQGAGSRSFGHRHHTNPAEILDASELERIRKTYLAGSTTPESDKGSA